MLSPEELWPLDHLLRSAAVVQHGCQVADAAPNGAHMQAQVPVRPIPLGSSSCLHLPHCLRDQPVTNAQEAGQQVALLQQAGGAVGQE